MSENLEHLSNIARAVIQAEDFLEDRPDFPWSEFSIVFYSNDKGKLGGSFGYAYDASGDYEAFAISVRPIRQIIADYRDWLAKDTDKGFMQMLFQFNRDSGQVQADFEYDDPMRWKVTPNNIDDMIEELRPNLGE